MSLEHQHAVSAIPTSSGTSGDERDADLTHAAWRTSSYSGGNGSCVEVADLGTRIAVRDSKDKGGPALIFSREAWAAFVEELKRQ